jgi:hypothetical protein
MTRGERYQKNRDAHSRYDTTAALDLAHSFSSRARIKV